MDRVPYLLLRSAFALAAACFPGSPRYGVTGSPPHGCAMARATNALTLCSARFLDRVHLGPAGIRSWLSERGG